MNYRNELVGRVQIDSRLNEKRQAQLINWITHLDAGRYSQGVIEHTVDYLCNYLSSEKKTDKQIGTLLSQSIKVLTGKATKWVQTINRSLSKKALDGETITVKKYRDGFSIVQLVDKNSYDQEAVQMSHCVSSYADNKGYVIFSLRDPNNGSHCTISVEGVDPSIPLNKQKVRMSQCKGKGNQVVHPKYIDYIIKFFKWAKIEIREDEMRYLGYAKYEKDYMDVLKKSYGKQLITKRLLGSTYVVESSIAGK